MTHDTGGAWEPVLHAQTTRAELDTIIAEQTRFALVDLLVQIETMGLGPRDQATAFTLVAPIVRARTAQALTAGWLDLRGEAGTVH